MVYLYSKTTNSCSEENEVLEKYSKLICLFLHKQGEVFILVCCTLSRMPKVTVTVLLRCPGTRRINLHFKQETINEIQIFNYYYLSRWFILHRCDSMTHYAIK